MKQRMSRGGGQVQAGPSPHAIRKGPSSMDSETETVGADNPFFWHSR